MDIAKTTGISQAMNALITPAPNKREAPQAPTAAAPVAPNDGIRATAAEATKNAAAKEKELDRSLDAINKFLQPVNSDIQFSKDEDSGRTLVKIVDTNTNTVLRQIPSKEMIEIAKQLDKLQGLLLRDKV